MIEFFTKKKNKQLIINCEKLETRVALMKNSSLEEYQIERTNDKNIVGSVYLGRILKLEPSLQAAFVDIGAEKNAFLHYWDMLPSSYEMFENIKNEQHLSGVKNRRSHHYELFSARLKELKKIQRGGRIRLEDIPRLFPEKSEILVQVTKGPIGTKGPRVNTNISIPGRYIVLLPFSDHIGISKKIDEDKERRRLKEIILEFDIPDGMGCICRTFGEGRKAVFFKRDLDVLLELWERGIGGTDNKMKAPCIVYQEPNLVERTMRDFLTEDIDEIVVDDVNSYNYIRDFIGKIVSDKMAGKVSLYRGDAPLFEKYGVEKQISGIYEREIPLRSGGRICIDETEALIAIDVNSGSLKGKSQAETIFRTNTEACDEIARQLRLRNIGGLVVIDFIDMRSAADRDSILKKMRHLLMDDRAKSKIYQISQLGLMEMTRQRDNESLRETVFDSCPYCDGRGKVKSAISMSVEIQRRLQNILRKYKKDKELSIRVIMHPTVLARMKNEDERFLADLESKYGRELSFRGDPSLHLEEFKLIDPDTEVEYK